MSNAMQQAAQFDARREPRFGVHWRGRLHLPEGRQIELRIKDISERGMGMTAGEAVPSGAMFNVTLRVPDPAGSALLSEVSGTVQAAYVAMRGYEFSIGVVWVNRHDAGRELMSRWIARLRCSL